MATGGGTKAIIAALLANLGIAIAKFVGFLITRASSLLAESVHSMADSGNQALLLFGGAKARRAPTTAHPFGYARARYFYSFVVAVVLFTLGSVFSIYEGYHKLSHPEELTSPIVGIVILVVGIVLESFSMRTAIVESNHVRGQATWWEFIRHSKLPELPVVLLEDLGALVGLVIALIGIVLAAVTGMVVFDAIGTIAIGVLLGVIAVILAIEMQSLLLGESATAKEVEAIRGHIAGADGVSQLLSLKTQHLGPDELLVAAHVELEGAVSVSDAVAIIDRIEDAIRASVPSARHVFIEPDTPRPAPTA